MDFHDGPGAARSLGQQRANCRNWQPRHEATSRALAAYRPRLKFAVTGGKVRDMLARHDNGAREGTMPIRFRIVTLFHDEPLGEISYMSKCPRPICLISTKYCYGPLCQMTGSSNTRLRWTRSPS